MITHLSSLALPIFRNKFLKPVIVNTNGNNKKKKRGEEDTLRLANLQTERKYTFIG